MTDYKHNPYRPWLYFGCYKARSPGHYLHDHRMQSISPQNRISSYAPKFLQRGLEKFDGVLLPETDSHPPYTVYLTVFEHMNYTAFAFWDFTGDSRGGSNSVFWCPTIDMSAQELWEEIKRAFPKWHTDRFPPLNFTATSYRQQDPEVP